MNKIGCLDPLAFDSSLLETVVIEKDMINPDHYKVHSKECIEELEIVFGTEAVIAFCKCNAWKYRYRAGNKDDINQEFKKSDWYIEKAKELQEKLNKVNK